MDPCCSERNMRIAFFIRFALALAFTAVIARSARAEDFPAYSPDTRALTERAATRYEEIAANGGWPALPPTAQGLKLGSKGAAVAKLKEHLAITGDLDEADSTGDEFDDMTRAALVIFQQRHGLSPT